MQDYPPHTLALDPQQPELNLKPPKDKRTQTKRPPYRAQGAYQCTVCGCVHFNYAERFRCLEGQ